VPEYFEDYCTMCSCNSYVEELIQAPGQHKDLSVIIF
jgi:predicted nucleic-acid-binding Zn-ribbon protein